MNSWKPAEGISPVVLFHGIFEKGGAKLNIFDKAVEIVNPSAALRRTQDRFKLQMIRSFQNSGYDESGASRNKNSMRGWLANSKTPQEDIDKNLPTLRQRSRLTVEKHDRRRLSGNEPPGKRALAKGRGTRIRLVGGLKVLRFYQGKQFLRDSTGRVYVLADEWRRLRPFRVRQAL